MSKINIKKIPAKPISYGGFRSLSSIKYIVIHWTANKGDTAENNGKYYANTNTREAGAHFFVDQSGTIVESIAMNKIAWAVGGSKYWNCKITGGGKYYGKATNSNSVSIELCNINGKEPSSAMIKAVRELITYIQSECPNAKTIIRHFDVTGKDCPHPFTKKNKWENLKMLIMPSAKTTKIVVDNGEKKEIKNPYSQPYTVVRKGDKGEFVKWVQWELKQTGYKLTVDGVFGKDTEKLLKKYQKEHTLTADGICGANTIRCMLTD